MSAVIYFDFKEKKEVVNKEIKVFVMFKKMWNEYLQKQNEIKKKKINFLFSQAYRFFYDEIMTKKVIETNGVELPSFIVAHQRAEAKARQTVLKIAAAGKVDHFYKLRIKELRKRGY